MKRNRLAIAMILGVIAVAVLGCSSVPEDVVVIGTATAKPSPERYQTKPVGDWVTVDGHVVAKNVIESFAGHEHCGWEATTYLIVGSPVGAAVTGDGHWYIKDPTGVFDTWERNWEGETLEWFGEFESDTQLPIDAVFSGYRQNEVELWTIDSEIGTQVYMVGETGVEHWPRVVPPIRCR